MTPQDIITETRFILNDTDPQGVGFRQSDAELLLYVNDAIREAVVVRPQLLATIGDMLCIEGQCEQSITFLDASALLQVLSIHQGAALTVFDIPTMNAFNPGWRDDAAGPARQWARYADDPLRFFIYPKAPIGSQVIDVLYVRNPDTHTIDQPIADLSSIYKSALVDYVVYRSSIKDDEYAIDGRATAFYSAFVAKIKGA